MLIRVHDTVLACALIARAFFEEFTDAFQHEQLAGEGSGIGSLTEVVRLREHWIAKGMVLAEFLDWLFFRQ
jgi:hypothetical protein